jgi:2-keto-3-deoxy-L-rhamnonate aldolase RhmA
MPAKESTKATLLRGEMKFGCFVNLTTPVSPYLAAGLGYDVVLLDHEHSPAGFPDVVAAVDAASATPAEVWARIPGKDEAYIKRVLDSGVRGVMCPMINTLKDAQDLVRLCHYPPRGVRGVAPTLCRHTGYGLHREAYMASIADELAIMPQIETAEAVENIDSIVTAEGIDIFFLGPFDLSASLGHLGEPGHPVVAAAIDKVEKAVRGAGKILASLAVPGRGAPVLIERGYGLIFGGSDLVFMRNAMQEQLKSLHETRAAQVAAAGRAAQ